MQRKNLPISLKGSIFSLSYGECDHAAMTDLKAMEKAMLDAAEKAE